MILTGKEHPTHAVLSTKDNWLEAFQLLDAVDVPATPN